MNKTDAIMLIDSHKNKLMNPVDMLRWTYLRVILLHISDTEWEKALAKALPELSK